MNQFFFLPKESKRNQNTFSPKDMYANANNIIQSNQSVDKSPKAH